MAQQPGGLAAGKARLAQPVELRLLGTHDLPLLHEAGKEARRRDLAVVVEAAGAQRPDDAVGCVEDPAVGIPERAGLDPDVGQADSSGVAGGAASSS